MELNQEQTLGDREKWGLGREMEKGFQGTERKVLMRRELGLI